MIRNLLRRFGVARTAVGLTGVSIIASVLITSALSFIMSGTGPGRGGLTIAIVVPLVIAPIMSLQVLVLIKRLDQALDRLRTLSITDDLTQAYNRRYFILLAETELARIRRYGGACSIALLDLDGFKQINDTAGHPAGDAHLRQFSQLCRQNLRAADTFARYGGDEFIVLLPGASPQVAREALDRIRGALAAQQAEGASRLSLSAGIAGIDPTAPNLDQLVKRADDALYAAKRAGGNKIVEETA